MMRQNNCVAVDAKSDFCENGNKKLIVRYDKSHNVGGN